ncbi:hypothetical protein OZ12_01875, partial [Xanthomonas translucens pv. translucens]
MLLLLLLLLLLLWLWLSLLTYRVPFRSGGWTGDSRQGQDAPSANPRSIRGPGARSAEGARQGAL